MRIFQKAIGVYFCIGAIWGYYSYISMQPSGNFFYFLIPNLISLFVFCFYTTCAFLYLRNFESPRYKNLFLVTILLQSLQLRINGFIFVNYYLPNLSVNLNFREISESSFTFEYYTIQVANGYFHDRNDLSISINVIGIALLVLTSITVSASEKQNNIGVN